MRVNNMDRMCATMKCPLCGREIKETVKYCPRCGRKIPRCPKCGMVIRRNIRFCTNDGTPLPQEIMDLFAQKERPKRQAPDKAGKNHEGKTGILLPVALTAVVTTLIVSAVIIIFMDFNDEYGKDDVWHGQETAEIEMIAEEDELSEESSLDENTTETTEELESVEETIPEMYAESQKESEDEYAFAEMELEKRLLYFITHSDSEYFTEEALEGFDAEMCRLARNGIYARRGRMFYDKELQSYFEQYDWYVPAIAPDDFEETMLNSYEIENRDLIVEYEKNMNDKSDEGTMPFGGVS